MGVGTAQTVVADKPGSSPLADDPSCCDDVFDRDLLLHLVQHATREAKSSESSIESALGVTPEQLEVIASFAGMTTTAFGGKSGCAHARRRAIDAARAFNAASQPARRDW